MSGSPNIHRLKLSASVDDARLAHQIARITGEAPSRMHKLMRDEPEAITIEFSIFERNEFSPTGGVFAEEIERILSACAAANIEPVVEEFAEGKWCSFSPKDVPDRIRGGEEIRRHVEYLTDLETGDIDEETAP